MNNFFDLKPLQRGALFDADKGPLCRCRGGYRRGSLGVVYSKRPVNALVRAQLLRFKDGFESSAQITDEGKRLIQQAQHEPAQAPAPIRQPMRQRA